MRILIALAIVCCAGTAGAQTPCPSGPTSTSTVSAVWVEPQPLDVVFQQVPKSLAGLGYEVNEPAPGAFVTAPKFSWSLDPSFNDWRELRFPGVELGVILAAVGPWTSVRLTTRLVCETGQAPPPSYPADID